MRPLAALLFLPSLLLAQEKGIIFGVVVDERDELVLECRVQLLRIKGGKEEVVATTSVRGRNSPFCDGLFTSFDVEPGNYTLKVLGKYMRQIEQPKIALGKGQFLFVSLRVRRVRLRPGAVRGMVVVGREAIEGLIVELVKKEGGKKIATTSTDRSGRYEFRNVEPGEYLVVVRYRGTRLAEEQTEVRPGRTTTKSIKLPEKTMERLRGHVFGEVRDAKTRKPLRGASVRVEKAPEGYRGRRTVRCDDKGRFDFGYLPPGRYTFLATARGYEEERRSVRVRERGRYRLSFSLKPKKRR